MPGFQSIFQFWKNPTKQNKKKTSGVSEAWDPVVSLFLGFGVSQSSLRTGIRCVKEQCWAQSDCERGSGGSNDMFVVGSDVAVKGKLLKWKREKNVVVFCFFYNSVIAVFCHRGVT